MAYLAKGWWHLTLNLDIPPPFFDLNICLFMSILPTNIVLPLTIPNGSYRLENFIFSWSSVTFDLWQICQKFDQRIYTSCSIPGPGINKIHAQVLSLNHVNKIWGRVYWWTDWQPENNASSTLRALKKKSGYGSAYNFCKTHVCYLLVILLKCLLLLKKKNWVHFWLEDCTYTCNKMYMYIHVHIEFESITIMPNRLMLTVIVYNYFAFGSSSSMFQLLLVHVQGQVKNRTSWAYALWASCEFLLWSKQFWCRVGQSYQIYTTFCISVLSGSTSWL